MNRTQIYLPKRQIQTLRQEAQKRRTTVSGVIRGILDEKLEKNTASRKKNFFDGLLELAEKTSQMGKKAPRDLATNMDTYLYGGK